MKAQRWQPQTDQERMDAELGRQRVDARTPEQWFEHIEKLEAENRHLLATFERAYDETWRDSGAIGPEGQYEGEYHAAQLQEEIKSWTK